MAVELAKLLQKRRFNAQNAVACSPGIAVSARGESDIMRISACRARLFGKAMHWQQHAPNPHSAQLVRPVLDCERPMAHCLH